MEIEYDDRARPDTLIEQKKAAAELKNQQKKDAIALKVREREEAEELLEKQLNEIKIKIMILNLKYGLPAEAA